MWFGGEINATPRDHGPAVGGAFQGKPHIFRRNVPLLLLNHTDWTLSCCASYIPYKHAIIILLDFDTELSFLFFISMLSVWHICGCGYFYSVICSGHENVSDCAVSFVPVEFCHSSCDTSLCHSHLIVAGGEARRPLWVHTHSQPLNRLHLSQPPNVPVKLCGCTNKPKRGCLLCCPKKKQQKKTFNWRQSCYFQS